MPDHDGIREALSEYVPDDQLDAATVFAVDMGVTAPEYLGPDDLDEIVSRFAHTV